MNATAPQLVIDMGVRRPPPHGLHSPVPFESIGLRVPCIQTKPKQIDGGLQPRFSWAQHIFDILAVSVIEADADHAIGIAELGATTRQHPVHFAVGPNDSLLYLVLSAIFE